MECLLNIRYANVPLIFFFTLNPFLKRVFGDVILLSVVYFWFIMVLISNRVIVIFQSWYILFWNNFWIGHTYWKDNLHNVVCLTDENADEFWNLCLFDSSNVSTISDCAKFNTKMGNKQRKDIGISSAAKFVHYYYLLNNYMMILKYLS